MSAPPDGAASAANGASQASGDWRKLGLIAGGGALPKSIAEACAASGKPVFIMGLSGWAEETTLAHYPHDWAGIGEIGKMMQRFQEEGCDAVTFAGIVHRPNFKTLKVDWRGARLLPKALMAARKGDDALLRMVVETFEGEGFRVLGAEEAARALTIPAGALGRWNAEPEHHGDIARGFTVARALGAQDIGQAVVVCDGLVLAVEAQEGTDAMLARAATLPSEIRGAEDARRGVLVKAPKPGQERRIDLPTVGVATVAGAAKAGLAGIAVEAGGALIIDREAVAAAADAAGLFVLAVDPATAESLGETASEG